MSEQTTMDMKAARRALSFFSKMPVWLYEFALKQTRMPEPPKRLAQNHSVESGCVDGINYVWINKDNSTNGVLVHAHGGGYTAGPFEAMWDWLCALTDATNTAGVLVDYRKAGTAPYPAAPDDLALVIKHLQQGADLKSGKWAIVGDSAGGGLALILTRRQLASNFPPACVVALSPFVNMALDHPETPKYEPLDISISRKLLSRGIQTYAAGQNVADPELSPINADVSGFPPISLCVGTNEMFLPDIRAYKEKLEAANIELEYHEEPGAIHVYPIIVNSDESRRAVASHAAFLKKHLGLGAL
ncbi:MAG: alpha/beta hydrolase fold domain-containing protein [Pseudomonadota bacterium]